MACMYVCMIITLAFAKAFELEPPSYQYALSFLYPFSLCSYDSAKIILINVFISSGPVLGYFIRVMEFKQKHSLKLK